MSSSTPSEKSDGSDTLSRLAGLQYGLLGVPLAFVALPLYVVLPEHYARTYGVPLATLGLVLLAARLLDAVADPLIGRWVDARFAKSGGPRAVLRMGAAAGVVLVLAFAALFFPPPVVAAAHTSVLAWCAVLLAMAYLSYSVMSIGHQSWGAMLATGEAARARVVAWREGLSLVGVIVASVLPSLAGLPATVGGFAACVALGLWAWSLAPRPRVAPVGAGDSPSAAAPHGDLRLPFANPAFRRLLAVFVFNGIASAVPATLLLFFIRDRLQLPTSDDGLFLSVYFLCAGASIALWVRAVARFGLARVWGVGMVLAVLTFVWAVTLGAGDKGAFVAVCALSGIALGADLAVPSALLAGVIQAAGHGGQREGAYFGWWNFATKLNLALAAGLALPTLSLFGYSPGARDEQALQALTIAYCALPCLLKLVAAALLYVFFIRRT
jgi:Na+/melibiose symporter-like transporter